MFDLIFNTLGTIVIVPPILLLLALFAPFLLGLKMEEDVVARCLYLAVILSLFAAVGVFICMLLTGERHVIIDFGHFSSIEEQHFHFEVRLLFDRLSIPFSILTLLLCGTIGAFTSKYLHREPGYHRFFIAYALFLLGMLLATLAGTIEILFLGWELVGLSSALLIAYFQDRIRPVESGLYVWCMYRAADAAFLIAALLVHTYVGGGEFEALTGITPWPDGQSVLNPELAFIVGLLLIFAACVKSALFPFGSWLPRAMEGPTCSSAIFYGALSIHLGAYLLLRVSPLIESSQLLTILTIFIGVTTAIFGTICARVQADIKTALGYAAMAQAGIIVAETGFGFYYLALSHIIGHACLRTLQLLRAPTLLHDYKVIENAVGEHVHHEERFWDKYLPKSVSRFFFTFAYHRGYLDELLMMFIVAPFLRFFRLCDRLERAWLSLLSGQKTRKTVPATSTEIPITSAEEKS